jgi:chemotaxis protein MotA
MNKTTIAGLLLAVVGLMVGMYLKGVAFSNLLVPAAYCIILAGTAGAVTIATPGERLKNLPKLFGIIFKGAKLMSQDELINTIYEFSVLSRKEGILALDSKQEEIKDPFLKTGIKLIVDGVHNEDIVKIMDAEIDAMEDRHAANAQIFSQGGLYAPTLGVLGAVMGLIAALGEMDDIEKLGHAIAAAFIATLLGIFTGYVIWHPFANKLKQTSKLEVRIKLMTLEGILGMQEGLNPELIKERMTAQIETGLRSKFDSKEGKAEG